MNRYLGALALVSTVACSGQYATQYVGAAMNEATPEAEGSFKLTLFARTDTGFGGVVEIGPPVTGSGSAYAWHEGPELRVITIDATDGDTILWMSKQADAELGGQFEVTGGGREGQTGTWRATLTRGPAASPATLQLPHGVLLPPVSALWPLLLLLAVGAAGVRWIRKIPPRTAPVGAPETTIVPSTPRKQLGGWLSLFTFMQGLVVIGSVSRLSSAWTDYESGIGFAAAVTGMESLLLTETIFQLLAPILVVIGIVLVLKRSAHTPRYWFAYFGISAVYLIADAVAGGASAGQMRPLLGNEYQLVEAQLAGDRVRMIPLIIGSVVWMLYWRRSTRVRATFGAGALDTVRGDPVPHALPVTPAQRRTARWRLAIGTIVGVVVTVLGLYAIGSRMNVVTPYSVAGTTDIRDVVAGRWSWVTEKPPCGEAAHVISFSDSGTVMRIVTPDIAADSGAIVTVYDIESATSSTIRGAIRGETRLTDEGKPVVWDLVLAGPDEYRWRRTDWPDRGASYTPAIMRCPAVAADSARG